MNSKIEKEIKSLKEEIINMGTLCETAINIAVNCAIYLDCKDIDEVYNIEKEIDKQERYIEDKCMSLLLQQNTFATDFRVVSSSLKMISDFERIGDQAQDIAELSKYIVNNNYKSSNLVKNMAKEVISMLKMTVDAVIQSDINLAKEIIKKDNVVDSFFDDVKYDIINLLQNNGQEGEVALDVFMVAKYLERIGDHCTNVAEWIVYSITGIHKDSNA